MNSVARNVFREIVYKWKDIGKQHMWAVEDKAAAFLQHLSTYLHIVTM